MSLSGDKYDPYSIWNSVTEFDWFEWLSRGVIHGDQYGTGPIPMPSPVISEIPRSMEDLQREQRELEAIINEQPFIPQGPLIAGVGDLPEDIRDIGVVPPDPNSGEDDDVTHTWGHLFRESAGTLIGGWLGTSNAQQPLGLAPPSANTEILFPSTAANQAATAVAMEGCDGMAWSGGTPPKGYKVVNHCGVGVLRKVRRRRRRRMLTASDASDLATIVGIVGKGQMAAQMINRR